MRVIMRHRLQMSLWTMIFIGAASMSTIAADARTTIRLTKSHQNSSKQITSPGNTTFYVDSVAGHDSNPGTSRNRSWKTIARANDMVFRTGDRLLFAGGQRFPGTIRFTKMDGGSSDRPVVVTSFGSGRATVEAGTESGFMITDCEWIVLQNLDFAGCGRKNGSNGSGISVLRTRNVKIDGTDVSGFRLAGLWMGGDQNTVVSRVLAHDNGYAGIASDSGSGDVPRARNLTIRDCITDNNPGDPKNLDNHSGNGIVVGGVDGALIEYCEASNNGWDMPRDGNGPVGIWAWNSDRVVIQHCISHHNKSPGADGGGFDFDGGVTNSVIQYNLAYENMGCGYLLCQYGGAAPWRKNIVRYNISFNDGSKNFQSGIGLWLGDKGISDAQVYNNTIVNGEHAVSTLGDIPGMVYRNNLFIGGGELLVGDLSHSRFENNAYWSTGSGPFARHGDKVHLTLADWVKATSQETIEGKRVALVQDPEIVLPAGGGELPTDPRALVKMRFFRLRAGSPCAAAGMTVPGIGERDLFDGRVRTDGPPTVGAFELQTGR